MADTLFWLRELAAAAPPPDEVGGKARHLALLIAAGLPVPDGFVLPAPALRTARANDLWEQAHAAAAHLGSTLAVRSSSAVEDRAEGAAPGLFSSRLDIRPDELGAAVREVLASAESSAVRAYLEQLELSRAPHDLAVIVQRQVGGPGSARGVLYTRPPGQPGRDDVWVEAVLPREVASTAVARRADGAAVARDRDFPLSDRELAELVRLGLAAEQAIEAGRPGADIEWVAEPSARAEETQAEEPRRIWLVQARPIRAARSRADAALADELAFSAGDPDTIWRWDASHNPDPLSPAQIGLVEWVAAVTPSALRLVGGYLYVASRNQPARDSAAPAPAELRALFDQVRADIARALAPVETAGWPDLRAALDAYRAVYQAYMGRLAPALARARAALERRGTAAPQTTESAVARAVRSGDRAALAALAPVWDVAAPTLEELGSQGIDRALAELGRAPQPRSPQPADDLPGVVRSIGEADDLLFFRAQRAVRRALLGLARSWRLEPDDIFYLPLDQILDHAERSAAIDPARAHATARAARDLREAQRSRAAPLAFRDGRPIDPSAGRFGFDFWRGRSAGGGSARGPALRALDLGQLDADPAGQVIVAQAVTPAALVQLAGAAALVCEQGGVLDHAAALARELGMPCVVGCAGAWRDLRSGDIVLVDGDAGVVVRLGESALGRGDSERH